MLIKIKPADKAFSLCVRERANWTCECCGKYYPEGSRAGLHCSHFHGRGNWSVRFDPLNAFAHCFGCHMKMEANPHDFTHWMLKKIGQGAYDILLEKKNDTNLGRMVRKTKGKGEIAKHYRDEHRRMLLEKEQGVTNVDFVGWI